MAQCTNLFMAHTSNTKKHYKSSMGLSCNVITVSYLRSRVYEQHQTIFRIYHFARRCWCWWPMQQRNLFCFTVCLVQYNEYTILMILIRGSLDWVANGNRSFDKPQSWFNPWEPFCTQPQRSDSNAFRQRFCVCSTVSMIQCNHLHFTEFHPLYPPTRKSSVMNTIFSLNKKDESKSLRLNYDAECDK